MPFHWNWFRESLSNRRTESRACGAASYLFPIFFGSPCVQSINLGFTSLEECCDPLYLWVISVLVCGEDVGVHTCTCRLPESYLCASICPNPQLQPPIAVHNPPAAMAAEIVHRLRQAPALAGRLVVVRAEQSASAHGNARPSSPTPVPSAVERELDGADLLSVRVEVSR
jgi:hypothetical protein